jgi:hypothetical protein
VVDVQRTGALGPDGLQVRWVQAQQPQDGGRDLGGVDGPVVPAGPDAGAAEDEGHVAVLRVGAAVLGDLALLAVKTTPCWVSA